MMGDFDYFIDIDTVGMFATHPKKRLFNKQKWEYWLLYLVLFLIRI